MTDFDSLPLHDAVLYRASLEWEPRVFSLEVAVFLDCSKPAIVAMLTWTGVRSVRLPCESPWGPSVFINRACKAGPGLYELEIQSGDVLQIEADSFSFTPRDAI